MEQIVPTIIFIEFWYQYLIFSNPFFYYRVYFFLDTPCVQFQDCLGDIILLFSLNFRLGAEAYQCSCCNIFISYKYLQERTEVPRARSLRASTVSQRGSVVSLRGRAKSMKDISRKRKVRSGNFYKRDSLSRALVSLMFLFLFALFNFLAFILCTTLFLQPRQIPQKVSGTNRPPKQRVSKEVHSVVEGLLQK